MPQPQSVLNPPPPASHLDRQTIERLAALARIRLTAEEMAAIEEHLHSMLGYIEKLQQVDTEGIEPTAHVAEVAAPLRLDAITNQQDTEALLHIARARHVGSCEGGSMRLTLESSDWPTSVCLTIRA